MAIEVTMPQMGADMTEGTVVRWLKQVGDEVKRGDIIAEIETDKATVELEAFDSGTFSKVVVNEGETVPVGDVIALLGAADEVVPEEVHRKPPAETPARRTLEGEEWSPTTTQTAGTADQGPSTTSVASAEKAPPPPPEVEQTHETISPAGDGRQQQPEMAGAGRLRVSPVARRIAGEAGVDLTNLRGSGPDGRILRRDVEEAIRDRTQQRVAEPVSPEAHEAAPARQAAAPAAPGGATVSTTKPLSKMRQAIARRMTSSKQQQPHYYLTLDVDMTDALEFRKQLNESATEQQRVSINDLVIKACALALERHPHFNAAFSEEGLKLHDAINISIGIAMEEGLIAPAILHCEGKGLGRIATEAKDLIERAKNGRLTAAEYSEGTFTITNLGAYGVEMLVGIINPPQAAILGVGSVMPKPVVRDDEIVVRQVMKVALSADHRVTDGAEGAVFIKEIQQLLEQPASLAL